MTTARPQLTGRLRKVAHCDFRCSEWTNLQSAIKEHKLSMNPNDVIAMVSSNGKQVVFCYTHEAIKYKDFRNITKDTGVVQSVRYRITGSGTWNPLMLRNYAEKCGIDLPGLKKFETYFDER